MPASLATLDTAMVDGVVEEPMMMSALDSVTKRRELVVALVGSPPSSSTMTLSGTPPISLVTNSSALRSGMPSAAAGPVVVTVMPIMISLVCAERRQPRQCQDAAIAAADEIELSSLFLPDIFVVDLQNKFGRSNQPFL